MGFLYNHRYFFANKFQHYCKWLPDGAYLRLLFRIKMGCWPHLRNPQTFNEKLQWLKLHDHRPIYTTMVDKLKVKEYVANTIGAEYVVPTIASWRTAEEIDWEALPQRFVLKCTHDSGGLVICTEKSSLDKKAASEKLRQCLQNDFYKAAREWPYKDVERRIIAEEYIESPDGDLKDYKFFCFDGKVRALFVASDRNTPGEETKFDFFDADYNHLPFTNGHPNAAQIPARPHNFELMKQLAARLSKDIPEVRIDLYEVGNRVLFGEMTFFHHSGLEPFTPEEWDYTFGSWVNLDLAKGGM